jgi:hypothetical protein
MAPTDSGSFRLNSSAFRDGNDFAAYARLQFALGAFLCFPVGPRILQSHIYVSVAGHAPRLESAGAP